MKASDIPTADINTWAVFPSHLQSDHLPAHEEISCGGWTTARCSDGRFAEDGCFVLTGNTLTLLEGVLLNKSELLTATAAHSTASMLQRLREQHRTAGALTALRGVFSGIFLNTTTGELELFANQTGDTAVYLYQARDTVLASNSFDVLMRLARENGLPRTYSERAGRLMLSYGYMIDETTFAQEVRRILPGTYAILTLNPAIQVETRSYWVLQNAPMKPTAQRTVISEFDERFCAAVRRGFGKDVDYGYRHLADLSGGLDARVVNFAAAKLGYHTVTNITYGQSGCDDVRFALQTAKVLNNTCLILPLDNGNCLLNPESTLRLNSGAAYYGGITGAKDLLELLNLGRFGLEHVGQLGDVVAGTFASASLDRTTQLSAGRYSTMHPYPGLVDPDPHDNLELRLMNTRGFLGAVSTHLTRSHYTYAYSPFMDIDLLEYAMSIPISWRQHHSFYLAWLRHSYPRALQIPTTRRLPSTSAFIRTVPRNGRRVIDKVRAKLNRAVGLPLGASLSSMNPMDLWFQENHRLRALLRSHLEAASNLSVSSDFRSETIASLSPGATTIDNLLGATVVRMHLLYFTD